VNISSARRHRHYDPHVPVYFQIETLLRDKIQENARGWKLPSESALARDFHVSRSTMRRALANLAAQKAITRKKGSGTYVSDEPLDVQVKKLTGFIDDLMSFGLRTHAKVLECRMVPAAAPIAKSLAVRIGDPVLNVCRVRYVEDVPLAVTSGYLPWAIGERFLHENLETLSVIHLLTKKFRISISEAEQTVEATLADPETAGHLNVLVGSPLLEVDRVYFSRRREPKYYSRSRYRADRYKFTVSLKRRA
jgi:GntR family transcriptional regulator